MPRPSTRLRFLTALPRVGGLCVLAGLLLAGGCFSYTTGIPGVLDLRSDGTYAEPLLDPLPGATASPREGWSSLLLGTGLRVEDGYVALEERQMWLGLTALFPGLFRIAGAEAEDSLALVLDGGAVRDLQLSHSFTPLDALLSTAACATICVPVLAPLQWFTFTVRGQRVVLAAEVDEGTPLAPPLDVDEPAALSPVGDDQP